MQMGQPELPSMDPRVGGETDSYFFKKRKKVMSGCTGGTGVGNMAIGPSPPHPGIENVTSIPAT